MTKPNSKQGDGRGSQPQGLGYAGPEIAIATLMREVGGSGVQSHVRTLRQYLESASRPVTVVTPFSSTSPLLRPVFGARYGIRLVSQPTSVWWYRHWHAHYLEHALVRRLSSSGGRGVVYAQCPVSANVALRTRTAQPVVMAVHFNVSQADEFVGKGEIPRQSALFRSIRTFEARVLPQLDGVVYVSSFMRALLEERIPALKEIPSTVVPNSVNIVRRYPTRPIGDLITVGALEPRKNQEYLLRILQAASTLGHRYTLTVVGDGPDRAKLEALSRRLGLSDHVRFLGYQADPRLLMSAHRLYCHTASMENLPIALLEAMAEGLPVLATPVGGVPEVVRPGREGDFWSLDSVTDAAKTLVEMMEDGPRREAMAVAATARAAKEFSTDVLGPRLLTFLSSAQKRT